MSDELSYDVTDEDINTYEGPVTFDRYPTLVRGARREVSSVLALGGLSSEHATLLTFLVEAASGLDDVTVVFEVDTSTDQEPGFDGEMYEVAVPESVTVVVSGWRVLDSAERGVVARAVSQARDLERFVDQRRLRTARTSRRARRLGRI